MKEITAETTVGEIVRAVPARSRIFENLGMDYCCGGKKPLAEACRAKGLDPATVVALLTEHWFEDDRQVNLSLVVVGGVSHVAAVVLLWIGCRRYRRSLDYLQDWTRARS